MCDVICAMSDKKFTWSCPTVKPGLECLYENIGDIVGYYHSGLHKLWQPGSLVARKWREKEKMKRKWRENEEMERK